MGVPAICNGLLLVMLLTKVNHLLVGKLMEMNSRLSKVEAKPGIS